MFCVFFFYIPETLLPTPPLRQDMTKGQILDETDCIPHSTNTLQKDMNPIILPPSMGSRAD